jgi:O-antigen/teichoic acid export membrane protein
MFTIVGDFASKVPFLLSEILIAQSLGIKLYGYWAIVQVLVNYNNFSHFGLLSGLSKLEPIFIGRGETEKLDSLRSTAFYPVLFIDSLILIIFLLFYWNGLLPSNGVNFDNSLAPLFFLIVTQQFFLYGSSRLRNTLKFDQVAYWRIAYSIVFLLCVIFFYDSLTINALILIWGVSFLLPSMFFYHSQKLIPKWYFKFDDIIEILRPGFLIFLMGLSKLLLLSIDKVVLLLMVDAEQLSIYTISMQAMVLVSIFSSLLGRVYMPHHLNMLGKGTLMDTNFNELVSDITKLMLVMGVFASVGFALIIQVFLPDFYLGITPGAILIFSGVIQGMVLLLFVFIVSQGFEKSGLIYFVICSVVLFLGVFIIVGQSNNLIFIALYNLFTWLFLFMLFANKVKLLNMKLIMISILGGGGALLLALLLIETLKYSVVGVLFLCCFIAVAVYRRASSLKSLNDLLKQP